jgi:hypothetical protein
MSLSVVLVHLHQVLQNHLQINSFSLPNQRILTILFFQQLIQFLNSTLEIQNDSHSALSFRSLKQLKLHYLLNLRHNLFGQQLRMAQLDESLDTLKVFEKLFQCQ